MKKICIFLSIFIFSFSVVQAKMPECKCNKIKFILDKSTNNEADVSEEKNDGDNKTKNDLKQTKQKTNNKKDAKQ